jgi:hypothetical protein
MSLTHLSDHIRRKTTDDVNSSECFHHRRRCDITIETRCVRDFNSEGHIESDEMCHVIGVSSIYSSSNVIIVTQIWTQKSPTKIFFSFVDLSKPLN